MVSQWLQSVLAHLQFKVGIMLGGAELHTDGARLSNLQTEPAGDEEKNKDATEKVIQSR